MGRNCKNATEEEEKPDLGPIITLILKMEQSYVANY
jgi:hypothetical protein